MIWVLDILGTLMKFAVTFSWLAKQLLPIANKQNHVLVLDPQPRRRKPCFTTVDYLR